MTVKGILRFVIGVFIATLLLAMALPLVGIPRAQIFAPPFVYGNAKGKAEGVISAKSRPLDRSPFKTGVRDYRVDYKFRAPYTPLLLGPQKSETSHLYTGSLLVDEDYYARVNVGTAVPIRYETTYPVISGINDKGAGRSIAQGSGIFSGWLIWAGIILVLGYLISPWLERIMLRESF